MVLFKRNLKLNMHGFCKCGVRFCETNYHTLLCYGCGSEKFHGYTNTAENQLYNSHFSPSCYPTYSRAARFRVLVRRLFALDVGPKITDPVWHYLEKTVPFKTTNDIYMALKASSLVNKHYGQLHLFSKVFLDYQHHTINVQYFLEKFCVKFNGLLHKWTKLGGTSFFSYNWLIEQYLREHKLFCFLKYIKHLQCPRRRQKYDSKMNLIDSAHENVKCLYVPRQMLPTCHFLNEISDVKTPHN